MRQFLKYEFKNNWKSFLFSYALIIGSFLLLSIFIISVKEVLNATRLMVILYSNFILLTVGAMIASIVLFVINIVKSMYNSIFTDEGYLTLSFPKSTDSLIISKFISYLVWGLLYCIAIGIGVGFMYISLYVLFGQPVNELFDTIKSIFLNIDIPFVSVVFAIINGIVDAILGFVLLFLAFCIVNTGIARKGKVVIGILLYTAFTTAISFITSIADYFSFGFVVNGEGSLVFAYGSTFSNTFLQSGAIGDYSFNITMFIINAGLIVGLYLLCRYILKNHLELE